jgi:hypothetical protein
MAWRLLAHVSQNISKTHCPCTPWSCATPTSVAISPSNVLWRRCVSHNLVVFLWQPLSFMLSYEMIIQLALTLCQCKILAPIYTLKGLSNSANLSTGGKDTLLLSSPTAWWQSSFHSRDSHFFFQQVGQGSSNLRNFLNEVVVVVG